jgi:hypothetical protein
MTPRVSVVMPVRDVAPFVDEAISSILRQTLDDLELVIVDDGSTDGTVELIREHARRDFRIRVHEQQQLGLVAALNAGCSLASADVLARMDGDDFAEPRRLSEQLVVLADDPDTVLVGSAVTLVDERGRPFSTTRYPTDPEEIRHELLVRNCFAHPTVVFRRAAFESAGMYRNTFPHAEDYDLWLRLSDQGRLRNLSEPLVRYRIHAGQVTLHKLEEQAASMLGARRAACARWGSCAVGESAPAEVGFSSIRLQTIAAYVQLAAVRLDARQLDEASLLLDAALARVAGLPTPSADAELLRQQARLHWHRHRPVAAALLLTQAYVRKWGDKGKARDAATR